MLKVFPTGVAVETSVVNAIRCMAVGVKNMPRYEVQALIGSEWVFIAKFGQAQKESALDYIEQVASEINGGKNG